MAATHRASGALVQVLAYRLRRAEKECNVSNTAHTRLRKTQIIETRKQTSRRSLRVDDVERFVA